MYATSMIESTEVSKPYQFQRAFAGKLNDRDGIYLQVRDSEKNFA